LLTPVADEIYNRLTPHVYAENENTLAEVVLELLKGKDHSIAVAESCTGGMISSDLIDVSGCSAVFKEGFVTYSNMAKIERLFVCEKLLEAHGAVSPEIAAAMAEGAAKAGSATVGLSITGIAGPEGGTAEKPVGLVCIGLYMCGRETQTITYNVSGNRNIVRRRSAILALDLLRRNLQNTSRP
jgi:nicotinamide-nucleotide amidase